MIKKLFFTGSLIVVGILMAFPTLGQMVSEPFEFQFEGKTLRGLIEKPENQTSKAIILIIPGSGRTNFVEGKWFYNLRYHLVSLGLTVCLWDKQGCGKSDGTFDVLQPVRNSADEAIAAIQALQDRKVPGADKIGLWGLSRGGWICPLINEQFPIDFWISASGTDDKENFGYLVRSNLTIAGRSEEAVNQLYNAWRRGHRLFCTTKKYKQFYKAIRPLREDSLSQELFGYSAYSKTTKADQQDFLNDQEAYLKEGYFDKKSGLWTYVDQFDRLLMKVDCPVLALFGAQDSQVDWRKTKALYESTIGKKAGNQLTVQVFENCNHNMQKCVTCAFKEDLSALQWQACDGYYETMTTWLKDQRVID